jgi:hypothetical protein
MNKLTAHTVLVLFDLLALYGSYFVFEHWHDLSLLIASQVNRVEIQSGIGVYILLLIIPVTHLSSFIQWSDEAALLVNKGLIATFFLLAIVAIFISIKFTEKIEHTDYFYCEKESDKMTFSEFRVFTRTEILCTN